MVANRPRRPSQPLAHGGAAGGRLRAAALLVVALMLAALAGCQAIPADTEGTLDRVRNGVLRAGITHNPPWVDTTVSSGPEGTEVRLVEAIATDLQAEVTWTVGSEAALVAALHDGSLDVVAGGFTDDTPWAKEAAMTAPYLEESDTGRTRRHVLLTRAGENRFLTTVEQLLASGVGSP